MKGFTRSISNSEGEIEIMMETLKSVLTSFKNEEGLKRRKQGLTLIGTTSPTKMDDFLEIFLKGGRAAS